MRVLIVDDDEPLGHLLKLSLQFGIYEKAKQLARTGRQLNDGLEVTQIADPAQALQFLADARERVDLIFTDIKPAGRDGYAFMEACREKYRNQYGEIIVLTDRSNKSEIKRCILAGAKDYVFKPFTPAELLEHVFEAWKDK